MPTCDAATLKSLVSDASIGALTIDTSVFDRFACDLDTAILTALDQFAGSPVRFLLTDVVLGEIRSHMIRDAMEATTRAGAALKDVARFRRSVAREAGGMAAALGLEADIVAEVDSRIMAYMATTEVVALKAGAMLDADRLVGDYFWPRPPFHAGKGKRSEFPDAIALGELESWAEENATLVLAVSADAGWAGFAADSRRVIVVEDLATALELFHQSDAHTVDRVSSLVADPGRAAASELARVIERHLDAASPKVQAHSHLFFSADLESLHLKGLEASSKEDMRVIASDERTVTLAANVAVTVEAEASFGFSARDHWDWDRVQTGSAYESRDIDLDVPVVIRVAREGGPDDAVEEIVAEGQRHLVLDFGQVEPTVDA